MWEYVQGNIAERDIILSQFSNERILVATGFSEYSKTALDICLGVYRCMKTKLYVLHTIEKLPQDYRHLTSSTALADMK